MDSQKIKKEIEVLKARLKEKPELIILQAGLKQSDVSAWVNGKRKWSYEKILKIAEKLDIA